MNKRGTRRREITVEARNDFKYPYQVTIREDMGYSISIWLTEDSYNTLFGFMSMATAKRFPFGASVVEDYEVD